MSKIYASRHWWYWIYWCIFGIQINDNNIYTAIQGRLLANKRWLISI